MKNTLYYGDNLQILRDYIDDESIDLIYLDPPFNSNRSYNVIFKDESGSDSEAQIEAFDDSWHWGPSAEETYEELVTESYPHIAEMIGALRQFIGSNQMMAYLVMMAVRLIELHRTLKPTGTLYLHCDPTASHYLKVVLDTIFGLQNFQNEVIWKRSGSHGGAKKWGPLHDVILFYSKSSEFKWNKVLEPYSQEYLDNYYRFNDKRGRYRLVSLSGAGTRSGNSGQPWRGVNPTLVGRHWAAPLGALRSITSEEEIQRMTTQEKLDLLDSVGLIYWPPKGTVPQQKRYLDESAGVAIQDIITDIQPLSSQAKERLGYPTQKPSELLKRIISASSNVGDIVLDPFCGCGTTIAAAQELNRTWVGIDVTHLSISLQKYRLKDSFNLVAGEDYEVIGEPASLPSARKLALEDRFQFQWWALSLIEAKPLGATSTSKKGKKGADRGIDGIINFLEADSKKPKRVLIQVKSGKVKSGDIRDLKGTMEREKAELAVFVTLEKPTREMVKEAVSSGFYESITWQKKYPKLQMLTIEEILDGRQIEMPPRFMNFKQAQRIKKEMGKQQKLGL